MVLENYEHAKRRGAPKSWPSSGGCGEKADHYHRTRSDPGGAAIIAAIRQALADARVAPHEIDYINAHGTSTPENDKMEYIALKAVLGDHLSTTPISSNKSMIGHTLIAAGLVEAVFSVMTIRTGVLPPTINYDEPDPDLPLDVVPNVSRTAVGQHDTEQFIRLWRAERLSRSLVGQGVMHEERRRAKSGSPASDS